jgi:hypothetical protein
MLQFYTGFAHGYGVNPTMLQCYNWYMDTRNPTNTVITTTASLAVAYITVRDSGDATNRRRSSTAPWWTCRDTAVQSVLHLSDVLRASQVTLTPCVRRLMTADFVYEGVSKSFRTESITKYTLTIINTRWEATQSVMVTKLTRLIHKIAIQLHLVAESCTICSSRSRWPFRKLLDWLWIDALAGVWSRNR